MLNDFGYIAFGAGITGTVTVSGADGSGNRSTWTNSGDLVIGQAGTGSLTITGGGVVKNQGGYIGADSTADGAVTVSGVDGNGRASTWSNAGDLHVGYDGTGALKLLAGGQVSNVNGNISGGGNALVGGKGSSWQNSGRLTVGLYGTGALRVEGGATVSSADGIVGGSAQGDAVLTGTGTTWSNTGQFTVGSFGAGTLRIEGGASVTSNQGYIGANDTGSVTVTGTGSKWSMSPYSLTIGNIGTGSLTVENGGLVRAEGGVLLGVASGSGGTLLLQGPANNRGILETRSISGGDGAASVKLDGGLLRALADNSSFFRTFGTRSIAIGTNGGVIDTNGHEIEIAPSFTGTGALIKDGAGKLTLTGNSSAFSGAGRVVAGTLAVNGILGGTMDVINGRLQGVGMVGTTTNQSGGTIAPGNSIGTLTINGNYVGNGGRLEIETVLGGDASPSDRLVITGSTSGSTTVSVINQGGAGAGTVEGIKIIDVGGASNGTFTLQGNYVFQGQQAVVAGAYAYTLHKNGVSTPNDGDWYLRSVYTASSGSGSTTTSPSSGSGSGSSSSGSSSTPGSGSSTTGSSSAPGSGSSTTGSPSASGSDSSATESSSASGSGSSPTEASGDGSGSAAAELPGAVISPIYQPGAPLYEAYGGVLQRMNQLQTLRQRVGERFDGQTSAASPMAGHAVWTRIDGAHARVTPSFSTTGTGYTVDSWRLQIGVDGQLLANGSGMLVGGLSLHHGRASADVSSVFGRGRIASRGSGFAGTLTWYGTSGFYADAQAQFSWFDSDLSSTTTGRQLAKGKAAFGSVLGLELGQRFALAGGWSLTPQAQLSYARIDADSFVDPFGARVAVSGGDSLRGRLGLSADYRASWRDAGGRKVDMALYGIANLHYDFRGGTTTMVADARLTSREERLQGGLGLGAKYEWARYALYGEVEARTSLAHFADSHSIAGRAGLRISW